VPPPFSFPFADPPCPSPRADGDNVNGGLVYCGDHKFCCLGDWNAGLCTCDAGGKAFIVPDGKAQTIVGVTDTTFSGAPSIATTRPVPVPTSATSRPTAGGSTTTGSKTTPGGTPTGSGPGPTDTGAVDDGSGGGGGLSQKAKIGIGVGVGVGVAALAGLGVAACLVVKKRRDARQRRNNGPIDRTPAEAGTQMQQDRARAAAAGRFRRVGADREVL